MSELPTATELFSKLNSFHRNYKGRDAVVQFIGLQLCYTGSPTTVVARKLFLSLYQVFCRSQGTFPADSTQIGMHLAAAGISAVAFRHKRVLLYFYEGFRVFGMARDEEYSVAKKRDVYLSLAPYIKIVVLENPEDGDQHGKRVAGVPCKGGPVSLANKRQKNRDCRK
ncbi:uncharacterized protein LOC122247542 [Penaeus japonicus]|uniref:uncharacterized protein LOC122247542 n=1 Tax=Penaeus japonicus TaxID=27405 RepID=UPI001C70AFF8|nr:uncharacterized protein LOC122247542 [Penaeus japonicus]XP_042862808.1 uncharacterized protein LOC122247542 [Penaeus japonicus]